MQSALSASDRRSAPLPVTFFRIPCALMTDARFSDLSAEAKLLYGLLLDRVSLSEKNGNTKDNALKKEISDYSNMKPEVVAQLIRSWMNGDSKK